MTTMTTMTRAEVREDMRLLGSAGWAAQADTYSDDDSDLVAWEFIEGGEGSPEEGVDFEPHSCIVRFWGWPRGEWRVVTP